MPRLEDLKRFYKLMKKLEKNTGGKRQLEDCNPLNDRTDGGVYFFFEEGEIRIESGSGDRIVRIGKCQSYRKRISGDHKGRSEPLTGSVFRKWIANALFKKNRKERFAKWPDITMMNLKEMRAVLNREQRRELEQIIRRYMLPMRLLFLPISLNNSRVFIEKNAIGLLSEYEKQSIDSPSKRWLGRRSRTGKISNSGLWNSNFVTRGYEPWFLDTLERYVNCVGRPPIR